MRLRATPAVLSLSEALAHMKPGGRLPTEPPLTRVPPPSDLAIPQEPDSIPDHLLPASLKPADKRLLDTLFPATLNSVAVASGLTLGSLRMPSRSRTMLFSLAMRSNFCSD